MSLIFPLGRHEGRSWYTTHRGRLWIAAAMKMPTADDIKETEHMYEILKKGELISLYSKTV
jgi:hypothetical protein